MADMVLTAYAPQLRRMYGVGEDNDDFNSDLLASIVAAVNQINHEGDLATQITSPTTLDSTLTGLDEKYDYILLDGAAVHLGKRNRRRKGDPSSVPTYAETAAAFDAGVAIIASDIRNAVDVDETDNFGLGATSY
ncbi:MAG: hypothetical protein GY851_00375 [bacterium]|nr:hypothetical protein [bacterium]